MPEHIPMAVVWICAIVVFLILEGATVGLTAIWFACGALAALIVQLLKLPFWAQLIAFFLVSILALWRTRPFVARHNAKRAATNADRLLGQTGIVKTRVDNLAQTGLVRITGKDWSARSDTGEILEAGSLVRILRIEGVKLIVKSADEASAQRKEV